MPKSKELFVCDNCGFESAKWLGRCPSCHNWNCFAAVTQELAAKPTAKVPQTWLNSENEAVELALIDYSQRQTYQPLQGFGEANKVLGGGLVHGSVTLLGGEPGIGKSTLILQWCQALPEATRILYVCGEESPEQIKLRAERLAIKRKSLYLYPEVNFLKICEMAKKLQVGLIVIDSIQTVYDPESSGSLGTVSQIKNVAAGFLRLCKENGITGILVGHMTKDGQIAGPMVLEHMVDTVLIFEGESGHDLRLLRASKNRFGTVNELAVLQMTSKGLDEVKNPSEILLSNRPQAVSGSAITAQIEGVRPLLLEVQALLTQANLGQALRMTQGFDRNRLNMLLALVSKQFGLNMLNYDCFINVIGGLKISEPACDLAVTAAILSSYYDMPLADNSIFIGELGLTGELRQVSACERRLKEAVSLGVKNIYLPSANKADVQRFQNKQVMADKQNNDLNIYLIDQLKQLPDVCLQKRANKVSEKL